MYDQTYSNIELLVIDDASPDGTFAAAGNWASSVDAEERFHRFRLERNGANLGAHGSINRGCSASSGEYIAILNSDDLFHPQRIERMVERLESSRAGLGFSRVVPIDDAGKLVSPAALPKQLLGAFYAADHAQANSPSLVDALAGQNLAISTGNLIFSRDIYAEVGPFADLAYVHDWDFIRRASLLSEPVYVPEDLYLYRIHGSNSFSALAHVAELETHIVQARFSAASGRLRRRIS
ncbi:hypothetical protein GCM10027159_21750 [Lysobacter terrae]